MNVAPRETYWRRRLPDLSPRDYLLTGAYFPACFAAPPELLIAFFHFSGKKRATSRHG
jgi:hypothetical protein